MFEFVLPHILHAPADTDFEMLLNVDGWLLACEVLAPEIWILFGNWLDRIVRLCGRRLVSLAYSEA